MEISKKQRNEIYRLALENLESEHPNIGVFLCSHITLAARRVLGQDFKVFQFVAFTRRIHYFPEAVEALPEFFSFHPKNSHAVEWWPVGDMDSRIAALQWCIEQTNVEPPQPANQLSLDLN